MKIKIILIFALTLIELSGCAQNNNNHVINSTIPLNWEKYSNDNLGITFQYPNNWINSGEESFAIDRTGARVGIKIYFIDSVSNTSLLVDYHFAPNGAELYNYAESQHESSQGMYSTDSKVIMVAGNKAIEAVSKISTNGKGMAIIPPLRLIVINFLDKQQTGSYELQFRTPILDNEVEVAKFNQLITTINFLK